MQELAGLHGGMSAPTAEGAMLVGKPAVFEVFAFLDVDRLELQRPPVSIGDLNDVYAPSLRRSRKEERLRVTEQASVVVDRLHLSAPHASSTPCCRHIPGFARAYPRLR